MLVYKVTFLNNKIISCGLINPSKHKDLKADVFVSQSNGLLIFALIKANSKQQALEKAKSLIEDLSRNKDSLLLENNTDNVERLAYAGHVPDSSDETVSTSDYIDTTIRHHIYGASADFLENEHTSHPGPPSSDKLP